MHHVVRRAFPYVVLILAIAGLVWAVSFQPLPPAEFTFDNGTEVQTLDPAKATGATENRIINGLFEGLLRTLPPDGYETKYGPRENVPFNTEPAMAESYEVSEDGKTYTFHMRKGAVWSDGSPVTSHDFAFSWQRMLHPETAGQYTYQLYYVKGTEAYNLARFAEEPKEPAEAKEPGEAKDATDPPQPAVAEKPHEPTPVEVELTDRPDRFQTYPRGTIVRGKLLRIEAAPRPKFGADVSAKAKEDETANWKRTWSYIVQLPDGTERAFSKEPRKAIEFQGKEPEACLQVLTDWESTVGVKTPDEHTLVVELNDRTPFFHELVAFYPLYPVNRKNVEKYGSPAFTKPENLVSNGPFTLNMRKLRDRIRMVKNEKYWDAEGVKLKSIDALALGNETTALNMYLTGKIDWATTMPAAMIPQLKKELKDQFPTAPMLTVYFYRFNTNKPGLGDKRVRQALNLAVNKAEICEFVTKAGEVPAGTFVPPGLTGYESPPGWEFDPEKARKLLAEAGYPGGRGFPHLEILYNDNPVLHRTIAETIQQSWRKHLGIDVQLSGLEWGVYLDAQHKMDYYVSRAGWIADYPDPNTFLDMFVTGGPQNMTGWGSEKYDELIAAAGKEADPARRMAIFKEAEALFLDEMPILPMYFYVSKNLVKPHVKGFCNDVQDLHPLSRLSIDRTASEPAEPAEPASSQPAAATSGGGQ